MVAVLLSAEVSPAQGQQYYYSEPAPQGEYYPQPYQSRQIAPVYTPQSYGTPVHVPGYRARSQPRYPVPVQQPRLYVPQPSQAAVRQYPQPSGLVQRPEESVPAPAEGTSTRPQLTPEVQRSEPPSTTTRSNGGEEYTPSANYSGSLTRRQPSSPVPNYYGMTPVVTPAPQYRRGDDVERAQRQLEALGFDPGSTDGVLGPRTEAALRDFQKKQGITGEDLLGQRTREALDKAGEEHLTEVAKKSVLGKLMAYNGPGASTQASESGTAPAPPAAAPAPAKSEDSSASASTAGEKPGTPSAGPDSAVPYTPSR